MKAAKILIALILSIGSSSAQIPKLYVQIVSHNEPNDNLDAQPGVNYSRAKTNALQMANIIDSKNARWNLQTSDGFVIGALQYDSAGTTSTDIFEVLSNPPYSDNIEIDPRPKNKNGRNIADQWYLLDSCGANPTTHLGGFIYTTSNPGAQPIDWLQYRNPIIGNIYGNSWQCSIIAGAGSYPPHQNDLHDFGVFKPDTTNNFYQHNPAKNLWCMGIGCATTLDSIENEQAIIDLIRGQVDSIQNGLWPANKFYVTKIMTGQSEYGPMFFQKISKVIDSLNTIDPSKFQWATIGETFAAFQAWQISSGLDYSQWLCGQTITSIKKTERNSDYTLYPNPFDNIITIEIHDQQIHKLEIIDFFGRVIFTNTIQSTTPIDLSKFSNGNYLVRIDNYIEKILKH